MPLRNRVDPFGNLCAVAARGLFTGNRGVLHDPETRSLAGRRWTTRAWIICECEMPGRRRAVMGRSGPDGRAGWTELFFLDEVTALAAGHRPCFFCRRARAADFLKRFGEAFGLDSPRAPMLDRRLHAERFVSAGPPLPRLDPDAPKVLPDGTMIADDGQAAYALRGDWALPWSFGGYGRAQPRAALRDRPLVLVTPPTTVKVLAAGYQPVWHPSADPA